MKTKKTLRKLPPNTRKLAEALNDLEKAIKHLNALLPAFERFEHDSTALFNRNKYMKEKGTTFIIDNDGLIKRPDEQLIDFTNHY